MTDFSPTFAQTDFLERLASLESPPPYVLLPSNDAEQGEVRAANFVLLTQDKKQLLAMLGAYPLLSDGQGGGFVVPGLASAPAVMRQVDDGTLPLAWAQDLIANRVALPLASGRVIWRVVASEESALRLYGRCIHSRQQLSDIPASQWQDLARALSRFDAVPTQPNDTTLAFNAAAAQVLTYLTVGFGRSPVPILAALLSDASTTASSRQALTGRVLVQAAHHAHLPELAKQWQTPSCQVHVIAHNETQAAQWRLREPGLTVLTGTLGEWFDTIVVHDLAAWSLQNADGPILEQGLATLMDQGYDLAEPMRQALRQLWGSVKPGGSLLIDQVAFPAPAQSAEGLNLGYYPVQQAVQAECPGLLQAWAAWPEYGTWFQWPLLADGTQADGVLNLGLAQAHLALPMPGQVRSWSTVLRHGQGLALAKAWCCVAQKPGQAGQQAVGNKGGERSHPAESPRFAYQWRQGQTQAFTAQSPLLMPGAKTAQHDFFLLASQDGWTLASLAQALTRYVLTIEALVPQIPLRQWLARREQEGDLLVPVDSISFLCQAMPDRVGLQKDGRPFFVQQPDNLPFETLLQAVVNQETALTPSRWLLAVLVVMLRGTPQWGEQAQKRQFTRMQWAENQLAHMGWNWLASDWQRDNIQAIDWLADQALPTPFPTAQVAERDARILQLEEQLHHLQTENNTANEKVRQLSVIAKGVTADVRRVVTQEVTHAVSALVSAQVHQALTQAYESTLSWRVTKPLRRVRTLMNRIRSKQKVSQDEVAPAYTFVTDLAASTPVMAETVNVQVDASCTDESFKQTFVRQHRLLGPAAVDEYNASDLPRFDYVRWVKMYDHIDVFALDEQEKYLADQINLPVLGLVCLPTSSQAGAMTRLLGDLLVQPYARWELVILVSVGAPLDDVCTRLCATDARIRCVPVPDTATLNTCLQAAWLALPDSVERMALVTADTRLNWAGLAQLAQEWRQHPDWDLVYTDCDILNSRGERHLPHFKPDWNEELFYSSSVAPKAYHSLVSGVVWAAPAQWQALTLPECQPNHDAWLLANLALTLHTMSPVVQADRIGHLPIVMAHLAEISLQPSTRELGLLQLGQYFAMRGEAVELSLTTQGLRVDWPLPQAPGLVSVIIPTRNNPVLLRQCVTSMLEKTQGVQLELIVVDNGSDTPEALQTLRELAAYPQLRVVRDNSLFNYSALNNHAVGLARGEWVALVNDDIEVIEGQWLTEMLRHAARPSVGVVGAKLLYPDGTVQHAGVFLAGTLSWHAYRHFAGEDPGQCGQALLARNSTCLTAACIVVRRALYEQVGGLDAEQLTVGWNDTDFCLKVVSAGYQNVWTPYACLVHHESATRGQDQTPEKKARAEREWRTMQHRWGVKMWQDPAYNPNLSCGYEDYSLAWPPRYKRWDTAQDQQGD